jgi:hypothetical protein
MCIFAQYLFRLDSYILETTFRFKASDLNEQFIIALKTLFKDQEIEISVREFTDETEQLLSQPENEAFLTTAIEELNSKKNLVKVNGDDYDSLIGELTKK